MEVPWLYLSSFVVDCIRAWSLIVGHFEAVKADFIVPIPFLSIYDPQRLSKFTCPGSTLI